MIELGETYSSDEFLVRDTNGDLTTPGSITCVVSLPDGTTATPTMSSTTTGVYAFDYVTTLAGSHQVLVTATGGALGTVVRKLADAFEVEDSTSARRLVSLDRVKQHLNQTGTTRHDEELQLLIASATMKIEHLCGPVLRRVVTNERHPGGRAVALHEVPGPHGGPYITLTSALPVAGGTGITVAGLDVDPLSGLVQYASGYGRFPVGPHLWSYVAGRATVPPGIQEAALNFVRGSWETQRGASGLPLDQADELQDVPGMGLVSYRLEQDLAPFLRVGGIA